jgi:hypothetical protein
VNAIVRYLAAVGNDRISSFILISGFPSRNDATGWMLAAGLE